MTALIVVLLGEYALGLSVGLAVTLGLLRLGRGNWRRALVAVGYAPLLFALGFVLWQSHLGPVKTLGNLGEFLLYGFVAGLIPLGQVVGRRLRDTELGEVLFAILACVAVAVLYASIPTQPEIAYELNTPRR